MIRVQIEISPGNIIPLTVPDEQFVTAADTEAIAREIPGNNVVGSLLGPGETLIASGEDLNPDGTSKRQWLSITWDAAVWPRPQAEAAFRVLQEKQAMIAAGKSYAWKEDRDGTPVAKEVPKPIPPPPPPVQTVPGPGGFPIPVGTPGSAPLDWQRILRRLDAWMDALNVPKVQ